MMKAVPLSFSFKFSSVLILLSAMILVGPPTSRASEANVFGLPEKGADGSDINYTQSQLQSRSGDLRSAEQFAGLSTLATDLNVPEFRPSWSFPFFASDVGRNLWAGPSDSGQPEIYVSSSQNMFGNSDFWSCLQYDSASKTYMPTFVSEYFPENIRALTVGNVIGDSGKEIIIALEDGTIVIYDQATKDIVSRFRVPARVYAMRTANLNGGSLDQIILCNYNYTAVLSGTLLQWYVPFGGTALAVGQMDEDPAVEIAVSRGQVIDGATRAVQWDRGASFGAHLEAADIDNDGMAELIASESWNNVRAFDVEMDMPKWTYKANQDITALAVTDVDGDGNPEIAIGDGQWGNVFGIDPSTHDIKYSIPNPVSGVSGIAAADVDSDGMTEIIWGGGYQASDEDIFCVSNPVTAATEWQSPHLDGPVLGPLIGDLDGDQKDELVIASSRSNGYDGGRILVFDNATLKLRAISPPVGGDVGQGIYDLELSDTDDDGKLEILVAANPHFVGLLEVYKFDASNTFTLAWTKSSGSDEINYWHVDAGDIDSDGDIEILAGSYRELQVIDYKTKAVEWTSFDLQAPGWEGVGEVALADLDTTPGLEIVAQMKNGSAFIFDGKTYAPRHSITGPFNAMQVDGKKLFLATTSGLLKTYVLADDTYSIESALQLADGMIDGFNVVDATAGIFTFGKDGRLNVFAGGKIRSRSADYAAPYGRQLSGGATAGQYSLTVYRNYDAPVLLPEPLTTPGESNIIQWNYTPGAVRYTVQAAKDPGFAGETVTVQTFDTQNEFVDLQIDSTYFYRVKAEFWDRGRESAWSEIDSSTQVTPPAAAAGWNLYN